MENNTSPQYGGDIPKKDRSPISMLKIYTPDAAPESQYPPATEQPEDECVVDERDCSFWNKPYDHLGLIMDDRTVPLLHLVEFQVF